MSKYYKAEDVIKAIEEMQNGYNGWSDTYDKAQIIGVLEELPAIDTVCCEECKYAEECEQIVVFDIGENQIEGRKIEFCSHGERID